MRSQSVLTLCFFFLLSFGVVWKAANAYDTQEEPKDDDDDDDSAEIQKHSTAATTKRTTPFKPKGKVVPTQPPTRSTGQTDNSAIMFPKDEGYPKCEDTHTCSTLDNCHPFSKKNPICGWNGNYPLVCCLKNQTKPPLDKSIFNENECFRRVEDSTRSRRKRATMVRHAMDVNFDIGQVGGSIVRDITQWPFMVSIFKKTGGKREFVCGGVLISRKHVLSAAHCFQNSQKGSDYDVMRGLVNLESMADNTELFFTKSVKTIVVHPDFRVSQLYHDLALLTIADLDFFSPETRPVCLPPSLPGTETDKGSGMHLAWGNEQFNGDPTDQLQAVFVNHVSQSTCELENKMTDVFFNNSYPRGVTPEMICAGNAEFSFYACQGDTAGPLVVVDRNNVWRVVGVSTMAFSCFRIGLPGIYTRVSSYLDWIKATAASG